MTVKFNPVTRIELSGTSMKFFDANLPNGATLTELYQSGSASGGSGGGSNLVQFGIFHGNISSPQSSGTKESIGMTYLDQAMLSGTRNYFFKGILAASTGTTIAYADLYDYSGIINGFPQPISGSVITGSSISSTYFSVQLSALTSVTGSGLIEARVWCTPTGTNNQVICKNAKIDVQLS